MNTFEKSEANIIGINVTETGKHIGELMKNHGYTEKELAKELGVSIQAINKWHHGRNLPDIDNMYYLSILFDTTMDGLLVPMCIGAVNKSATEAA